MISVFNILFYRVGVAEMNINFTVAFLYKAKVYKLTNNKEER